MKLRRDETKRNEMNPPSAVFVMRCAPPVRVKTDKWFVVVCEKEEESRAFAEIHST